MSDATYLATIEGHRIDLPDNRSVWAGKYDDSWYIVFTNGEAQTRVRLTFEASSALVQLLTGDRIDIVENLYRYVVQVSSEGSPVNWVAVDGEPK